EPLRLLPNTGDCAKGEAAPLLILPLIRKPSSACCASSRSEDAGTGVSLGVAGAGGAGGGACDSIEAIISPSVSILRSQSAAGVFGATATSRLRGEKPDIWLSIVQVPLGRSGKE